MDKVKERILAELRSRSIKLWQPPYFDAQKGKNDAALAKLASVWSSHLSIDDDEAATIERKIGKDEIYEALVHFQTKALDKLKAKQQQKNKKEQKIGKTFTVKILGLRLCQNDSIQGDNDEEKSTNTKYMSVSSKVLKSSSFSKLKWADEAMVKCEPLVALSSNNDATSVNGPMVLTLTLQNISSALTISSFMDDLKTNLNLDKKCAVRMIYQGTNLLQFPNQNEKQEASPSLYEQVVACSAKSHDEKPTILCLLSPPPPSSEPNTTNNNNVTNTNQQNNEQQIVTSIKKAAADITKTTNFDITDQNGKIVPMTTKDRLAFLMTLGLHRLGQKRLYEDSEDNAVGEGTDGVASALIFLLQADAEWNNSSASTSTASPSSSSTTTEEWKTKADNYGLLQLDIAWSYLKLASIQYLPDALSRLEVAESVLRKQVHSNFVTLALVQAELEHGVVPPLAAVFVRLFLLQGVGYLHQSAMAGENEGNENTTERRRRLEAKANERLNWSFLLCQKLRSASSPASVLELQQVVPDLSQRDAICALRKSNGNANAAVELIEQERADMVTERYKRSVQKRIGLCENGMDYVNLDLVGQLGSMLGLESGAGAEGQGQLGDYSRSSIMTPGGRKNQKVIESLLRLSNNDVGRAVDFYQGMQMDGDEILHRVSKQLDHEDADSTHFNRKRSWDASSTTTGSVGIKIDDMALATLESLGVEESMAKMALKKTKNDVDASLVWLTDQNKEEEEGENDAVSTSGSSSSSERYFIPCGGTKPPCKSSKKNTDDNGMSEGGKDEEKQISVTMDATNKDDEMQEKKKDEEEKEKLRLQKKEEEDRLRREQQQEEERARRKRKEEEAFQILRDALEHHGGGNDTMGYYIGSDLEEEWSLLQKYRKHL